MKFLVKALLAASALIPAGAAIAQDGPEPGRRERSPGMQAKLEARNELRGMDAPRPVFQRPQPDQSRGPDRQRPDAPLAAPEGRPQGDAGFQRGSGGVGRGWDGRNGGGQRAWEGRGDNRPLPTQDAGRPDRPRLDPGPGDARGYDRQRDPRFDARGGAEWRARQDNRRDDRDGLNRPGGVGDRNDWNRPDRQRDRNTWNQYGGGDRSAWGQYGRDDRGGWNQPGRNGGGVWSQPGRNSGGVWNRTWRNDRRYDWNGYRQSNRSAYRLPRYYAPSGWTYGYRRFSIGATLSTLLWDDNYWIDDPYTYRLPAVYGPYRWVRYYDDALLIDIRTGRVVDTVYDIFW